ncbi:MAG: hypothetical protein NVS9B10_30420 [Nevskia sp.]
MEPMNNATLERLLEISAPWSLIGARFDDTERQLEVHVGIARSGWFGAMRGLRQDGLRSHSWRHLGLGAKRVRILLECPEGTAPPQAPWAGVEDSPFTAALSQRLLVLFGSGVSLAVASAVLDLDPQEVWRFKRRLDIGQLGASGHPADAQAEVPAAPLSSPAAEPQPAAPVDLPDADHGVWRDLLSGSLPLEIGNLGLQLFLARLRAQFALARDEDARSLKAHELRRYCEKNIKVVSREIAAIRSLAR